MNVSNAFSKASRGPQLHSEKASGHFGTREMLWLYSAVNVLIATKLDAFREVILCYANVTSI